MSAAVWVFTMLLSLALLTAGVSGYVIFGPLTFRHLMDRKAQAGLGAGSFSPTFVRWILVGGHRASDDRQLHWLAGNARILAWVGVVGGFGTALSALFKS